MTQSEMFPVGLAAGMVRRASQVNSGLLGLMSHIRYGSFTLSGNAGSKEPVFWFDEATWGSANCVQLKNPGLKTFLDEDLPQIAELHDGTDCAIDISLAPQKSGDLKEMHDIIRRHPNAKHIRLVEENAACPNHRAEGGVQPVLAYDPLAVRELLREWLVPYKRRALKIAPRTSTDTLRQIVKACVRYGVDEIVSGNTLSGSSVIGGRQRLRQPTCGRAGLPLLEDTVDQARTLVRIIHEINAEDRLSVTFCGGVMIADALRQARDTGAAEAQVATLFYQFETRGVQEVLTKFYTT